MVLERVDDDWLVLDSRNSQVHRLSGSAARVIDAVTTGAGLPPDSDHVVAALIDAGILTTGPNSPSIWTRRRILATGTSAAAAIGLTTLALPNPAAAASPAPSTTTPSTSSTVDPNLGITWALRTSAADNNCTSVTYGNGLFVAVSGDGSGNRVMTSPDGTNWTIRNSAADNYWYSVTYGNGLFVAVSASGSGNRVMTSPDGINWTAGSSIPDNNWYGVTYGDNKFVAVSMSGTGTRVMSSPA